MFVQMIKGSTSNPAALRSRSDSWRDEIRPGAAGFLGSTGGATADGSFFLFARFTDEAAARSNSERAEQSAWWNETAALFDGTPTFRESSDVSTLFDGGSDRAGFVQVMEGRVSDRDKAEAFETPELLEQLRRARPDLIGAVRAWFGDGTFAEVAYFTDEASARSGESSADFEAPQQAYTDLFTEMTFSDLHDPFFVTSA